MRVVYTLLVLDLGTDLNVLDFFAKAFPEHLV